MTPEAIVLTPSNARLAVDYAIHLVETVNASIHKTYENNADTTDDGDTLSDTSITFMDEDDDDMCTVIEERLNTARGTLGDPIVLL